jgi:adenine-specific DNA-methyltransferase
MANTPINKTLRPVKEDSLDWEDTENLYIEGDNLEVLKLLQESYLNKVKCIYIDPPYNTGKDFIYRDSFTQDKDEYLEESGQVDEEGNRLFQNTEYNGRYHSDWLTMMYPRLKLARNLLAEDGVIFISIDDNEVHNLRKICDEVFGEKNEIGLMTIQSNPRGSQASRHLSNVHEYIQMYSKNDSSLQLKGIPKSDRNIAEYTEIDHDGRKYRLLGLRQRGGAWKKEDRPKMHYPIHVNPKNGEISLSPSDEYSIEVIPQRPSGELSRWTWGSEKVIAEKSKIVGRRVRRVGDDNAWDVFRKDYLHNDDGTQKTAKVKTIWIEKETNYQNAKVEIRELFGNSELFDFPKPTYIVKRLISMLYTVDGDIILDFFSGSATTAHAVMQLNAEDGGNRKYIMVQLPEPTDEKSEAYQAGYKSISEIGKERIRRAGRKIKEETGADIDYGFRVFKVDSTNMKDVYYRPDQLAQTLLDELNSNIKEDRTSLDLLTQIMLEMGLELSLPIETREINGKEVHFVAGNSLVACFDEDVDEGLIREIAKSEPLKVVFRDSSFASCPDRINLEEIFKSISPGTEIKVL